MDFPHLKGSAPRHKPTPEVLPASQYLQDRLLERRARNTRPKRTRQSDVGPRMASGLDDDLFFAEAEDSRLASRPFDSSPLAPFSKYGSEVNNGNGSGTLSAGGRKRRTPGARELDEQMDRLTKQNFDLKLELDHRRENQAKLHAEIESMRAAVERAERLEEEHAELMRINSLLVEELEKRDKAIQEAADIICELEEKVEDYEEARATETRPSTAHADSGYAGTETQEQVPPSSPPEVTINDQTSRQTPAHAAAASARLGSAMQASTPARPRREPAFLTSQKPSTTALRSVYLDAGKDLHPVKSFNSILSKRASTIDEQALADEVLNSPRLSALSESSFPSIYGKNGETPEKFDWENEADLPDRERPYGSAHSRQDSISRVNQWIEDRESMADTPSKSNRISSPLQTETILESPHQLRKNAGRSMHSLASAATATAASAKADSLRTPASIRPFSALGGRQNQMPRTPAAPGSPVFGEDSFPPTPDSVSTRMLRMSRSSAVGERSLLDTTPAQVNNFAPLQPRSSVGPAHMESAAELRGPYQVSNAQPQADSLGVAQRTFHRTGFEDFDSETDDEAYDSRADAVGDFGMSYDGYPDGNSITNGTPSRFLKHNRQPSPVTDMFFNSNTVSPPFMRQGHPAQRRKSSSEVKSASSSPFVKPGLFRAETSPTTLRSMPGRLDMRPTTSGSAGSADSYESGSSSFRTAVQDRESRSRSPDFQRLQNQHQQHAPSTTTTTTTTPPKTRPAPSPRSASTSRSSLTQKTQNLLRRLSNTNTNTNTEDSRSAAPTTTATRPTPRREREKSPLPHLTSTPAAAYQMRRPSTSSAAFASPRPGSAAPSPRAVSRDRAAAAAAAGRPGVSPRTMTEPGFSPRPASAAGLEAPARKGLFRSRGSVGARPAWR